MNLFIKFMKICKEIFFISGLAVADFFFNLIMFVTIGIMSIITLAVYLVILAIALGGG